MKALELFGKAIAYIGIALLALAILIGFFGDGTTPLQPFVDWAFTLAFIGYAIGTIPYFRK